MFYFTILFEMEALKKLIDEVDLLLNKQSRKQNVEDLEKILNLQNQLFDASIKLQEQSEINKMKHKNVRA